MILLEFAVQPWVRAVKSYRVPADRSAADHPAHAARRRRGTGGPLLAGVPARRIGSAGPGTARSSNTDSALSCYGLTGQPSSRVRCALCTASSAPARRAVWAGRCRVSRCACRRFRHGVRPGGRRDQPWRFQNPARVGACRPAPAPSGAGRLCGRSTGPQAGAGAVRGGGIAPRTRGTGRRCRPLPGKLIERAPGCGGGGSDSS